VPGHEVLTLRSWSIENNDAWIAGAIAKRQKVYLASDVDANWYDGGPYNGGMTIYGRELFQLFDAGYTIEGDYAVPPAS
jgi:hypothetical protein